MDMYESYAVDNAMATRDATQSIPMAVPTMQVLSASWWDHLIAQIQALFARLGMMFSDIEARVDMGLSELESRILSNPALTPAAKQRIMNRLDASQMMIDNRFDTARMNLMGQESSTLGRLMRQRGEMRPGVPTGHIDLGGGDMVPATMVTRDAFGRMVARGHGMPKHMLHAPPGLAKRKMLPPGLAKRKMLPPGLANRLGAP